MNWGKVVEGAIGLYLILPGPEDIISGGTTIAPSALLGIALLADAFGIVHVLTK
jgi:hypothetical protein